MDKLSTHHADDLRLNVASQRKANISGMTKKFALAVARTAHIRVQLLAIAIEEVQAALQYDMITPEFAAAWLADIGALAFVNVEPFTNNLAATE